MKLLQARDYEFYVPVYEEASTDKNDPSHSLLEDLLNFVTTKGAV